MPNCQKKKKNGEVISENIKLIVFFCNISAKDKLEI